MGWVRDSNPRILGCCDPCKDGALEVLRLVSFIRDGTSSGSSLSDPVTYVQCSPDSCTDSRAPIPHHVSSSWSLFCFHPCFTWTSPNPTAAWTRYRNTGPYQFSPYPTLYHRWEAFCNPNLTYNRSFLQFMPSALYACSVHDIACPVLIISYRMKTTTAFESTFDSFRSLVAVSHTQ